MVSNIHMSLYNFSKDLVGGNLMNQYMAKYNIHTLDSATPVSVRLLSGRNNFKKSITGETTGENTCSLPIIYRSLHKRTGINNKIDKNTRVPLGMLMLNNDIFKSTQTYTLDFEDYLKLTLSSTQLKFLRHTFGDIKLGSTTLVPLKLICKRRCKFIKDPLLQQYLTLIDLPSSEVNNNTMIPLGILLVMKKLYY